MPIRAVLFDLDDTLYAQRNYVYGAYHEVSAWVSANFARDEEAVYDTLCASWEQFGSRYPFIFNDILSSYGVENSERAAAVQAMVGCFNAHQPNITLFNNAQAVLEALQRCLLLGLVTDGCVERQRRKVAVLGIAPYFTSIVYTGVWGAAFAKPHSRGYQTALDSLGIPPVDALFVGDAPAIDLIGAKLVGMTTVWLTTAARDAAMPTEYDLRIADLRELLVLLSAPVEEGEFE